MAVVLAVINHFLQVPRKRDNPPFGGFTLIEILVVVAIIGILAIIGFANFKTSLARARDAKRMSDLKSIQNVLEMYYNDHGEYPTVTSPGPSGWGQVDETHLPDLTSYFTNNVYPLDPRDNGLNPYCGTPDYPEFGYFYRRSSEGYQLIAGLEAQEKTNCPDWCDEGPAAQRCYILYNP